jgi:2',3'-cyclic-nucleotide 2'-phosphodiesterase (5'-nucleotidase family)
VSQFNNLLNFDASTLGNHEFDDKIAGLVPFMKVPVQHSTD